MIDRLRQLLALDTDKVDVRRGLLGAVVIMAAIAFITVFGTVGMIAGIAALFVIAADKPGPTHARVLGVVIVTSFGSAIALIAVWAGTEHVWVAMSMTFLVTAAATLAAGSGAAAATRGLLLPLWAVIALSFAGNDEGALALAAAFMIGGLAAALILWLDARGGSADDIEADAESSARSLGAIVRSPLGWFSLLRATAVAVATLLGIALFPDHAIWPALTVVLVLRPKAGEALQAGLLRTFGTLAGVLAAEAVLAMAGDSDIIVLLAFVGAAFAMVALQKVNYWVFVLFLTAILVFTQELLGDDADAAAEERLIATVLGAGIAFLAIAVGRLISRRPNHRAAATRDVSSLGDG